MAKTMKDFISEKQEREARRAKLEESITILAADVTTFTAEAEAEAAKGNVEGYSSFKGKAERAQIEAHVAEVQLKVIDAPFPVDDVRAAWVKYAEDYNKTLLCRMTRLRCESWRRNMQASARSHLCLAMETTRHFL